MIIIPELPDIEVEEVEVAEEITLTLRMTSPIAICPSCGTASSRAASVAIHGRYAIFPPLAVRSASLCMSVVFSARRAPVLKRSSRNDSQISAVPMPNGPNGCKKRSVALDLNLGGQAGADLGQEQGMSGSRDTILRLVRQSQQSAQSEPHVIGLDDWAWKRGMRYGTLICDLEQGLPIDLLPDRTVKTVSTWLQDHPSIDVVSRDGSLEYASAIKKGAPQARQVSDRWHLTKNLAACVSVQLAKTFAQNRRAEQAAANISEEGKQSSEQRRPARTKAVQQAQLARQSERLARYEQITILRLQGMKSADIAAQTGMTERTVRRWLERGDIPYSSPRKQRPRLIDPYKPYLLDRWHQGCQNGSQLERELRAKGYKGSGRAIYRYLETLEPSGISLRKRGSASATRQKIGRAHV